MKSLKALECLLSGSLADVRQALHNFSDSVDASLEDDSGCKSAAGRGSLSGLVDLVVSLVLLEEGDHSLGALLLAEGLGNGEPNGSVVADTSLGGIVEVGQVKGVSRQLLTIELHQE